MLSSLLLNGFVLVVTAALGVFTVFTWLRVIDPSHNSPRDDFGPLLMFIAISIGLLLFAGYWLAISRQAYVGVFAGLFLVIIYVRKTSRIKLYAPSDEDKSKKKQSTR